MCVHVLFTVSAGNFAEDDGDDYSITTTTATASAAADDDGDGADQQKSRDVDVHRLPVSGLPGSTPSPWMLPFQTRTARTVTTRNAQPSARAPA